MSRSEIANLEMIRDGRKVRAVCQSCDRRSRPVATRVGGAPSLWDLSGWSAATYPENFVHSDGSRGTVYTCPGCARTRDRRNAEGVRPLLSPAPRRAAAIASLA
ncbi:hypothetical protein SEA_MAGICMAN_39 [Gordonia phage MagicMan]|uniref:Uncharacterized protein n=1 Tax=Gordonia phage Schnabeltier TaxID=1821561 RepID=A0A142KA27_9CAUD|nr:hypothetical protein BJD60_gp39 [Gordonia phage Schnabeltier]AMS02960.1 hypothetical protein SEA_SCHNABELTIER_39 [Gordonia phage Schnabeltier]QDM55856.1 hypothetical protein SEA_MAGICMAN_39 [Gordonia phage MagicMan]